MLDDDNEAIDTLLDDVVISSEEEKKAAYMKHLLPIPEWGFPKWVFAQGAPNGFGDGVYVLADFVRNAEIFANYFIPWASHLIPEDKRAVQLRMDTFHQLLMHYGVLWCNFERITPTLLLLLNSKPPTARVAIMEQAEHELKADYEHKKSLYAEAYAGFQEQLNADNDEETSKELETLKEKFKHPPHKFMLTDEGRRITSEYLFNVRASRIKEDVSLSQYRTPRFAPTLPIYEIMFMYHCIKDAMDVYTGLISPVSNKKKYDEFTALCNQANKKYISDLEENLPHTLRAHPKLSLVLDNIHAQFDSGNLIPQWPKDLCPDDVVVSAMHMYTMNMVVAIEECIMTMIGLSEDVKANLSTMHQPERYVNPEKDPNVTLNDCRHYNDMVHSLRIKFLPNWPFTASGKVACMDALESEKNVHAYLKNIVLVLARHTYSQARINRYYLQMKQIVRPSVVDPVPYTPSRTVILYRSDSNFEQIPALVSNK